MHRKYILKIISINGGVLLALIFLLELILGKWLWGIPYPPQSLHKGGLVTDRSSIKKSYGKVIRIPDRGGLTIHDYPNDRRDKCNVLLMGGSTTEERVLAREETWSHRLWNDLNRLNYKNSKCSQVAVYNAGVAGHSIKQNFYDLTTRIPRLGVEFDVIVLYQGINDWFEGERSSIPGNWLDLIYNKMLYYSSSWKAFELAGNFLLANQRSSEAGLKKHNYSDWIYGSIIIDDSDWQKIDILRGSISHRAWVRKFIKEALRQRIPIVLVTQSLPRCAIGDQRVAYASDSSLADHKSKVNINLPNYSFRNKEADLNHGSALKQCLRMAWIRRNYIIVQNEFEHLNYIKVVDYGGKSRIDLRKLVYDSYHTDPYTSMLVYQEMKDTGLLDSIKKQIDRDD